MKTENLVNALKRAQIVAERIAAKERELDAERRELQALLNFIGLARNQAAHSIPAHAHSIPAHVVQLETATLPFRVAFAEQPQPTGPVGVVGAVGPQPIGVGSSSASFFHGVETKGSDLVSWEHPGEIDHQTGEYVVPPKYEALLSMIGAGSFDVALAARAIYNEDSERARNRIHAGLGYLKTKRLIARNEVDGSWIRVGTPKVRHAREDAANGGRR
ncbi:MAG: hypothetical protein ABUL60_14810 [Myxococcales bacterium]